MGNENKIYDLEKRTLAFALRARKFIKKVPRTISNIEDCKQLAKASASVGANYIEANEALSSKDFVYRIKICRKESKESRFFLRLIDLETVENLEEERDWLIQEATELMNIFGAIIRNHKN